MEYKWGFIIVAKTENWNTIILRKFTNSQRAIFSLVVVNGDENKH